MPSAPYGWWGGPGWVAGPVPAAASTASPRRPRPLVLAIGAAALLALVGLGVGIGYAVWGTSPRPAAFSRPATGPQRFGPFSHATSGRKAPSFTAPGGASGSSTGAGEGFLGVDLATTSGATTTPGAYVAGVVATSPAAKAGIVKGDTITAVGTASVTSASTLQRDIEADSPGQKVKISWTTSSGTKKTATVTLSTRAKG